MAWPPYHGLPRALPMETWTYMIEAEMSWIRTIGEDEADEPLARLYAAMLDPESRRVDNILKVHSLHLAGLEAHFALYRAVMAGTPTLRKLDREMIALVVSGLNGCHY